MSDSDVHVTVHENMVQMTATVSGHNITPPKNADVRPEGYVSSLTCTIASGTFRVTWRRANAPAIGSIVTVECKVLNGNGIPRHATICSDNLKEPISFLEEAMEKCKIDVIADQKPKVKVRPEPTWQTLPKDSLIFSISALKSTSGLQLKAGDKLFIPASCETKNSDGSDRTLHAVTMPKDGSGKVYCSCPAWRFQKESPSKRTCKHCDLVEIAQRA